MKTISHDLLMQVAYTYQNIILTSKEKGRNIMEVIAAAVGVKFQIWYKS